MDFFQAGRREMLDLCLTFEPGFADLDTQSFFDSIAEGGDGGQEFVYLLGTCYCSKDLEGMKRFSASRLWCTYRRGFPAIGGTGPTSDKGWGCMLRCGQMLMAQALSTIHLGRDWQWAPRSTEPRYRRLLAMFADKRDSLFSIHQIAQMGVSEGKAMGEWLGPNTIAQVLKKLAVYDDWSNLAVHVALDNLLISSDVHTMACHDSDEASDHSEGNPPPHANGCDQPPGPSTHAPYGQTRRQWRRPLLIIVPLRLGLTVINACYADAIKAFFKLPQCAGILGGRPNHAVYFFGAAGSHLLYLDPHVCQEAVNPPPPLTDGDDKRRAASGGEDSAGTTTTTMDHDQHQCDGPNETNQLLTTSCCVSDCSMVSTSREEGGGVEANSNLPQQPPTLELTSAGTISSLSSSSASFQSAEEIQLPTPSSPGLATSTATTPSSSSLSRGSACDSGTSIEMPATSSSIDSGSKNPSSTGLETIETSIEDLPGQSNDATVTSPIAVASVPCTEGDASTAKEDARPCSEDGSEDQFDDSSYHCPYLLHMDFQQLDPSLALAFVCLCQEDYDDLVERLTGSVVNASSPPLFEVLCERPRGWPEFVPYAGGHLDESLKLKEYDDFGDPQFDSDDQFEILE